MHAEDIIDVPVRDIDGDKAGTVRKWEDRGLPRYNAISLSGITLAIGLASLEDAEECVITARCAGRF